MPFTPVQTLIGASMLGISAYHVLILNGGVLGISGFAHRTTSWAIFKSRQLTSTSAPKDETSDDANANPDPDHLALLSMAGLLAGGLALGFFYRPAESQLQAQLVDMYSIASVTLAQGAGLVLAGFLVGLGSKLSNGSTATFFPFAVLAHLLLGRLPAFSFDLVTEGPVGQPTWQAVLVLQLPILFYRYGAAFINGLAGERYARQVVAFATLECYDLQKSSTFFKSPPLR
ncbi:hypothetical protein BN14_07279 [Rhizoctonia solani AG-1 IB]|uniref:Uncharacterized protein n=1 Tax=Thanatephorus cucumeris (strain AG1-IB / isolate 7/3/14) TaxID=1108050 RepID=M5C168_THACB|nr:hypothetical protein BN14_07279 [Rhizoctonia solani AG-1 IB]